MAEGVLSGMVATGSESLGALVPALARGAGALAGLAQAAQGVNAVGEAFRWLKHHTYQPLKSAWNAWVDRGDGEALQLQSPTTLLDKVLATETLQRINAQPEPVYRRAVGSGELGGVMHIFEKTARPSLDRLLPPNSRVQVEDVRLITAAYIMQLPAEERWPDMIALLPAIEQDTRLPADLRQEIQSAGQQLLQVVTNVPSQEAPRVPTRVMKKVMHAMNGDRDLNGEV